MNNISRVLIANRGEIAVRIIRACKALGIESVVAVSEADKQSLPAKMADRCVCIGPPRASDSYLNVNILVAAALGTGANALHPGYGFLAEQPTLAEACQKHGIRFIGPSPESIRKMGNKVSARKIVGDCGISTIPGSEGARELKEAHARSEELGFPVLLKAAAGGGGRGMKVVHSHEDLANAFDTLSSEVQSAFGDGTLFIERYILNARHIEVQILADRFGSTIHLGERDCSIQRRYQKLIEESPSIVLSDGLRRQICDAAVTIAKRIKYQSAGTIEFVFDLDKQQFYFLEMNTRIQVEHPVTEEITGVDLVQEQIKVADDQPLSISQAEMGVKGHAIECRINAESPFSSFLPCPGKISQWNSPQGKGIRVDTHCYCGYKVPPYYDSLLAKVITWGNDRNESVERMCFALRQFAIAGVDTTLEFHQRLLKHPDFRAGKINTQWVENVMLADFER